MIEIKQEGLSPLVLRKLLVSHVVISQGKPQIILNTSSLPTLISHLIEMGGVAEDLPYAILSSLSTEQIVKHYHLVPKKKI